MSRSEFKTINLIVIERELHAERHRQLLHGHDWDVVDVMYVLRNHAGHPDWSDVPYPELPPTWLGRRLTSCASKEGDDRTAAVVPAYGANKRNTQELISSSSRETRFGSPRFNSTIRFNRMKLSRSMRWNR